MALSTFPGAFSRVWSSPYQNFCMDKDLSNYGVASALVKTRTGPDRTGSTPEVVNQPTTTLTQWADSYTKVMPCFREERETSVGSCTSIALFQGPRPASRRLQYSPARTTSDGKLPGNEASISTSSFYDSWTPTSMTSSTHFKGISNLMLVAFVQPLCSKKLYNT